MIVDGTPRFAIITTRNRPTELTNLVESLLTQSDYIVIVDNMSDPPVTYDSDEKMEVIKYETYPPNLYEMWNIGLDYVANFVGGLGVKQWDVAMFNDDVELPLMWYDTVATAMRQFYVNAASGDTYGYVTRPMIKTTPDGDVMSRMCPWAFVHRGELGLRADEDLRWWWGDTDFDWQLRQRGGVLVLPRLIAKNTLANSTTVGPLAEQAGRDGETFARKWGFRPW